MTEDDARGDAPPARPRRRKRIYPPPAQMTAEQGAARVRATRPARASTTAEAEGTALPADRMDVRARAVGRVEASEVSVAAGAVGAARADRITLDKGAVGAALANDVEVSRGYARSILARQVQIDRGAARMIVAADVRAERTAVVFMLARRVSGDVRVLFDWRGAIAFGAVAGLLAGLLARGRRRRAAPGRR